jgi:cell wall-associated NlpC family hydrolase
MATADPEAFGAQIAAAARAWIGSAFRPQGRGVGGLDCLGLVLESLKATGIQLLVPKLAMRGHAERQVLCRMQELGLQQYPVHQAIVGDVLLAFPATRQTHLAVRTETGFVEANAALRRVVERPWAGGVGWHSAWRLRRPAATDCARFPR